MKKEWKDYFVYLNELRYHGITKMRDYVEYLKTEFSLDRLTTMKVFKYWINNYNEIKNWLNEEEN